MRHTQLSMFVAGIFLAACGTPGPEGLDVRITPADPSTISALRVDVTSPAEDARGARVVLGYAWWVDGEPVDEEPSDLVSATLTERGQVWEVEVTPFARGVAGTPARASVQIGNALPSATVTVPEQVASTKPLTAAAFVADPDGDPVTLLWAWTRNGEPTPYNTDTVPPEATGRGEVWVPSVTLTDGFGVSPPFMAQRGTTIGNGAPTVIGARVVAAGVGSDRVTRATGAICEVEGAEDPDGDALTVSASWYHPPWNPDSPWRSLESLRLDGLELTRGEPLACLGLAYDTSRVAGYVASPEVVVENSPPAVGSAVITPSTPTSADILRVVAADLTDADADPLKLEVSWLVDGELAATGPAFAGARRGQQVVAVVVPFDEWEAGEPVFTPPVVVGNAPPTVRAVVAGPTGVSVDQTARVTPFFADSDGDAVSFLVHWTKGGTLVGTGTSLPLGGFTRGDVLVATVTPDDGTALGTPVASAPLTIANALPRITSLALTPTAPRVGDTVRAVVSAFDADGDPVSLAYRWSVHGTPAGTGTALVGGIDFQAGDAITLRVTPDDGQKTGAPAIAHTYVLGDRPTPPGVRITPALPASGDTLRCVLDKPSIDPSGGTLTYRVSWERLYPTSGPAWTAGTTTLLGDTLPGSWVESGQLWSCAIEASSGSSSSMPTQAYATVSDGVEVRAEDATIRLWGVGVGRAIGIPDADGDGSADLAFGHPAASEVVVYRADLTGDVDAFDAEILVLSGSQAEDRAGASLTSWADLDGDGAEDLVVGAPGVSEGNGRIYLIPSPFEPGNLEDLAAATWTGPDLDSGIGSRIRVADTDADGDHELLVGAPAATAGSAAEAGEIYVFEGPFSGAIALATATTHLQGATARSAVGDRFGVGDHDGDGQDDVLVTSASAFSWKGTTGGCRWDLIDGPLPTGTLTVPSASDWTIYPEDKGGYAGRNGILGDLNADGYDDLILVHEIPGLAERTIYVLEGPLSSTETSTLAATTTITDVEPRSPSDLDLGDVDASGQLDLVVQEVGLDDGGGLRIYLDLSPGGYDSEDADRVLGGAWYPDRLGAWGMTVVDLDADGFSDVITTGAFHDLREGRRPGAGLLALFSGVSLY
jgi:hypothetical protein